MMPIKATQPPREFGGADCGKRVELKNGIVFEFNACHYDSAYRPEVEVFKKISSVAELKALKVKNPTGPVTLYKLLIQDNV